MKQLRALVDPLLGSLRYSLDCLSIGVSGKVGLFAGRSILASGLEILVGNSIT